jgi:hypothetical protein
VKKRKIHDLEVFFRHFFEKSKTQISHI